MSAALPSAPNSLWNTHPELIALKLVCLQYDYFSWENFVKNSNIIQLYSIPDFPNKCKILKTPEKVNEWLDKYDALCEKDKEYN